ncbi:MAG TPA: amidase [Vicinamibacterales bacterium]|nr:amidase [Vicinamibacterales bacterium]
MDTLLKATILDTAPRIAARDVSCEALAEACLARIRGRNPVVNAFITVCEDAAVEQAREADRAIGAGRYRGPLHGIPISLKDLIDVAGVRTTAASRVLEGNVASADAPVVSRLRAAGAVILGKTNLHEFAFGTTSEDSAYGPVRNPRDTGRSAGGSSGGSAAAVVDGMGFASVGTDTGGSIRIPAAACGCVGLKPTRDELPCDGIVPLSWSLDHVGPIARSVADAWVLFDAMRGAPRIPGNPAHACGRHPPRIGVLGGYFGEVLDAGVRESIAASLDRLAAAGAALVPLELPGAASIAQTYLHIQLPEASAYHAGTLEQHPELYTPAVRKRLEMGRTVLAEDYVRARREADRLRTVVDEALEGCDVLALPTLPIPAPPLGADSMSIDGQPVPVRALMLRLTQLFDLTGHPALSMPGGPTGAGLPVGLQLVGRLNGTPALLGTALWCERFLG